VGLAAFGVIAHVLLACRLAVPDALLPAVLFAGLVLPLRVAVPPTAPPAPRWLPPAVLVLLAAVLVAIVYGATATGSRHWDGAAAWDTSAKYLAANLSLEQPYFRDPEVFAHSRDYPLLQPLLLASATRWLGESGGRVLFPIVFVLLAGVVGSTLRQRGAGRTWAWIGTAATMLTPGLAGSHSGGIDSGYGDAFLLLATTTIAAGLLRRDPRWLAAGIVLAVLVKPEGIVYAAAATVVAFTTAERRLVYAAGGSWLGAACCGLSLQQGLQHPHAEPRALLLAAVALGVFGALAAADAVARRLVWSPRVRSFAVLAAAPVVLLALPSDAAHLGTSAMQSYFTDPMRPLQRLAELPAIAAGAVNYALLRGGCGAAYWLLLLGLPVALRAREQRPLLLFHACGFVIVLVPFLCGQLELQHHLRSSMPRLLLHWVGAAMLAGTLTVVASRERSAEPEPHRETTQAAER
jgi:hypothetical protein